MLAGLSNWLLETGAKDESLVVAGEALDKFIDVYSEDTQVHNSMYMTWIHFIRTYQYSPPRMPYLQDWVCFKRQDMP